MKRDISSIKKILLLEKYQTSDNVRKMCSLVGMTNLMTCVIFYYWVATISYYDLIAKYVLVSAILIHSYLNTVLIRWTLPYENAKWMKWAWASLISLSPAGIMLIYAGSNDGVWKDTKQADNPTNTIFHSFTNSSINLSHILDKAISYLDEHYKEDFHGLLKSAELTIDSVEEWPTQAKYMVIALHEALKQGKKKKNSFDDIVWGAHWYDSRHFNFAIRDPKSLVVPNLRYKYSFGFVVLDEFNNYQKIVEAKKEIKANMKYGPAKAVCLHWGKGFKIYVNE